MKKTLIALVAVSLLTVGAYAQQNPTYASQAIVGGTFTTAAQAATNVAFVIDMRKQASVTLQFDNQMSTAATDVQTICVQRSVDGLTYNTALQTIALTPIASTASTLLTNLPSYGAGYLKIAYVTNAAATAIATNTFKYAIKISAP